MKLFYKHTQTENTMLKKNILFTLLLSTAVFATGCKDELEMPLTPEAGGEGTVPVTFAIGIADEQDGYNQGNAHQSRNVNENAGNDGFNAKVVPSVQARADAMPDKIYKLYVLQFDQNGKWLNGNKIADEVTLGTSMTMNLNSPQTDCQLLFIALGDNSSVSLDTSNKNNLSYYQELCADIDNCNITDFGTDGSAVNNHPYVLHLPHVKVTTSGIASPDIDSNGTGHDVRILLKRLAAKLTLKWSFADVLKQQGYTLKEVRLSQVSGTIPNGKPNHATGRFYFYPARESNDTYPTAEKEYVDYFRLKGDELSTANGSYSIWMPATVRGTSSKVTAPQHRNKDNAPEGACFVDFVAEKTNTDTNEIEDRLTYRIYLGGAAVNDFNIKENTNYTWDVKMTSTNVADPRITRLDMTPVTSKVQKNTSNCFMVIPGTDFYFNPYKHEAGTSGWNDELVNDPSGTPTIKTVITSVKVLWQSRDNGTGGELVLGRYISTDRHENLVNSEKLDKINDAKVFVKVPVSKGGNAVIAAYNGTTILWSWHLWITDYVPERMKVAGGDVDTRYKAAQSGTQNGTVHKYLSAIWRTGIYTDMVIMDRDLGAKKGGYPGIGQNNYQEYSKMDGVNREGLLYQWGRKDPFFGSADGTTTEINVIYNGDGTPLSLTKTNQYASKDNSIKNPLTFYHTNSIGTSWNGNNATAPGKKTIYDPSPEGWKVPMNGTTPSPQDLIDNGTGIFAKFGTITGNTPSYDEYNITLSDGNGYYTNARYYSQTQFYQYETTIPNADAANPKGGRIYFLADGISDTPNSWSIENTMWIPVSAERHYKSGNLNVPSYGHLWLADNRTGNDGKTSALFGIIPKITQLCFYYPAYGWSVRCIQDNK